jgi:hypothetical protein
MKRTLVIALCCLVAAATFSVTTGQDKVRNIPTAPPASPEALASLIANGAYQYAISIRSTAGEANLRIGDSAADSPRYGGIAAIGLESYGGIPMKTDGEYDAELPSGLYYKIKVVSMTDDIAEVKLTVGHATDVQKTKGVATWNEQVWTVDRNVKLDETDTVQLTAPKGKTVPSFDVRYRVRKFDGQME